MKSPRKGRQKLLRTELTGARQLRNELAAILAFNSDDSSSQAALHSSDMEMAEPE